MAKLKKKLPSVDSGAFGDARDAVLPSRESGLNKAPDLDTSATPSPARQPVFEARTSSASTETESSKSSQSIGAGRPAELPDASASMTVGTHITSLTAKKGAVDTAPTHESVQSAVAGLWSPLQQPVGTQASSAAKPGLLEAPSVMGKDAPSASTPGLLDATNDLVPHLNKVARWLPKKEDVSDLTLTLEGGSDAVGIDTLAQGDMFARVIDKGAVSIAYGSASFSAVAESTGDELAFASAFSDAHVSGADFVITWTRHESINLESSDGQYAKDVSTTYVFALDFEAWDLRRGPITVNADLDKSFFGELGWLPDLIEGNLATFNVDVQAAGENTYADVATSVLAVEDQLSSVSAIAQLGIG